jgi:hypothetical protein
VARDGDRRPGGHPSDAAPDHAAGCGNVVTVQLNDLLDVLDRAAANLVKIEGLWQRAKPHVAWGLEHRADPEYDDLRREWVDLLPGLPRIHGWTITAELPDLEALSEEVQGYKDAGSDVPSWMSEALRQPAKDIGEYRYTLNRTRRAAVRSRLEELTATLDQGLPQLVGDVPRSSREVIIGPLAADLTQAIDEVIRLMGDSPRESKRWNDLQRHVAFGQGQDWHDVLELDWPSVKPDIEAARRADADPLPVPDIDLGVAAAGQLSGPATLALPWTQITPETFERLLFDLLNDLPGYQNVQWLQRTNAADRGRDLSCERVTEDGAGTTRTERVIIQAKHWTSKSVPLGEIADTVAYMKILEPPVVRGLVIATSGSFTGDAVAYVDQHNERAAVPYIDLWPHSRLERLLAQRPVLAAEHGLRGGV